MKFSTYKMPGEKEGNAGKVESIIFLIFGIALFILGLHLLFLWYRPFVDWTEIRVGENCELQILRNNNGNADLRYVFEFNGKVYEKIFNHVFLYNNSSVEAFNQYKKTKIHSIFINPDDPLDAKIYMQGQPAAFWFCIMLIFFGIFLTVAFIRELLKLKKKNSD